MRDIMESHAQQCREGPYWKSLLSKYNVPHYVFGPVNQMYIDVFEPTLYSRLLVKLHTPLYAAGLCATFVLSVGFTIWLQQLLEIEAKNQMVQTPDSLHRVDTGSTSAE
ncbi:putative transmembrane protein [Gregarina niphandrodes]|uniref:Transmembrane protein n=1 Tax=Gregarina niphandrodes TaxID=110365 RepID=A0A023AYH5_GRENI|nr:putative transmembrane protein [Gregarina niphandrodes]EZG43722.1 putative transmembrane protein [Gregarina niphandrodes]|eukprot:XP_011133052.1 putative transmembrane protein [Gregarina niphandrodes]